MGFLDNFKDAMKRGSEAANAHIERERAKAAAESKPAARPKGPSAHTKTSSRQLPEGVYRALLQHMEPIDLGTNASGAQVIMNINGSIRFKADDGCTLTPDEQREKVKSIAREILERELALRIDQMSDVKTLLMLPNSLTPIILDAIKAEGFKGIFDMPLIIRPQ